jgi:hypothetical protein
MVNDLEAKYAELKAYVKDLEKENLQLQKQVNGIIDDHVEDPIEAPVTAAVVSHNPYGDVSFDLADIAKITQLATTIAGTSPHGAVNFLSTMLAKHHAND